ncbi:FAD-dependent oxidoreductase [Natrialba magadii ATCC 43099]|uniref:FAD-dependent oxidoreductase n=1 Tax=Natrialba magadii (strain ATCC 43099 / DSM 3394 / CCM 3739 / CIP 104546 / IAM 13178 / JCM 8861 / NBRC 102185 / NCIMB 2190 / MS3) TaxID=547559 RepID=D3STZ4_NATMM|nr:FAD-dependent oxidoreductase [Natrialba magadii]ADD07083.1 FAD-dependent oxidoreductase [Natrialba magadii ATCC 43099]ELY28774.1 FAD dependent oxidoreductase [Natrialba magadii ATCC 43099]
MKLVIVGGGIIGTATAARLGQTDHDVTLVERDEIGTDTTAASAGMLMRAAVEPTPFDVALRNRAWAAYQRLFEESGLEAERIGTLYLAETAAYAERLERSAATLADHGVDATFRTPDELAEYGIDTSNFDDSRDPGAFAGGLHTTADRRCNPAAVASWFADCAREAGVDVRTGVEVTAIRTRNGTVRAVETDTGRIDADTVINAAGPWAPQLNNTVGVSLPLAHTVGPMAELECPAAASQRADSTQSNTNSNSNATPFTILESKRYVRPGAANGSKAPRRAVVGEFNTGYAEGSVLELHKRDLSDSFRNGAPGTASLVSGFDDATITEEWVGYRTVTPDGRPIVGETDVSGFVVACGLTGLGITLAPAVADLVADAVAGGLDSEHREQVGPDRF